MSKWFEVTETIYKTHLVEVNDDEDDSDACQIVCDITTEDFDELKALPVKPEELELQKRHTDKDKIYDLAQAT